MPQATGTFNVALIMLPFENATDEDMMQRRSIEKTFHGAIDGTSKGQMLSVGSAAGSGAYVAVERVTATVDGKAGTFSLHHTGVMSRGAPSLTIAVVPDSGTGELAGISGTLGIDIKDKKHYYTFDYELG